MTGTLPAEVGWLLLLAFIAGVLFGVAAVMYAHAVDRPVTRRLWLLTAAVAAAEVVCLFRGWLAAYWVCVAVSAVAVADIWRRHRAERR